MGNGERERYGVVLLGGLFGEGREEEEGVVY